MSSLRKHHAVQLFRGLPDHYDRVGAVMSFGQDPRWRRALVDAVAPEPGMRILDVATGTGMVAFALAARGAEVVGLDQSEAMLDARPARLQRTPELAGRLSFVLGEAEALPFADGEFDALSFTYLLRYVDDPAATMRELARVVKTGRADRDGRVRRARRSSAARAMAHPHPGRAAAARSRGVTGLV